MNSQITFQIGFHGESKPVQGLVVADARLAIRGKVIFGEMYESFFSPLDLWTIESYETQWKRAAERLKKGGACSCFVVGVHPHSIARYVETWTVWRLSAEFRIQNVFMFVDDLGTFDPSEPFDLIKPYSDQTEDGELISDNWRLPSNTIWPS